MPKTRKAPAKKAPAKKAPAKKAPAMKAPAKKVPAKKAPAKKVPAKKAPAKISARAAGLSVEAYLSGLSVEQAEIARRIDAVVTRVTGSPATLKWGQPVWESSGPLAYLRGSSRHVTLGFWRGAELADPGGALEGEGERMRHLKVASPGALDERLVEGLVRQAVSLNAERGDPTRSR